MTSSIIDIRKYERLNRIIKHSNMDPSYLLLHKESVLALIPSLEKNISILEAFKELNNLDNAVAIRVYNHIINNDNFKNVDNLLDNLYERRDLLQDKIDQLLNIISGRDNNKDVILEYLDRHHIGAKARIAVFSYPILKAFSKRQYKKRVEHKGAKEENPQPLTEETLPNYKENFDEHKKTYESLKESINALLNKYYVIINDMTPLESQYYRIYCSLSEEELKDTPLTNVNEEYDGALARIYAIRLFDAKDEIDKIMQEIAFKNYSDLEEIEYLGLYIDEFREYCSNLRKYDERLNVDGSLNNIPSSKVFFLVDNTLSPMLPDIAMEKGYIGSLMSIMEKAEAGFIQQKRGSNIMPLRVSDERFKDEVKRTVFAVRNNKLIVSYIKLNSDSGISNDGGIMILTASLLHPNTIQDDTDHLIRTYCDQIIRQIDAIEKGDTQQLGLQAIVRNKIIGDNLGDTKEGEGHGRNIL